MARVPGRGGALPAPGRRVPYRGSGVRFRTHRAHRQISGGRQHLHDRKTRDGHRAEPSWRCSPPADARRGRPARVPPRSHGVSETPRSPADRTFGGSRPRRGVRAAAVPCNGHGRSVARASRGRRQPGRPGALDETLPCSSVSSSDSPNSLSRARTSFRLRLIFFMHLNWYVLVHPPEDALRASSRALRPPVRYNPSKSPCLIPELSLPSSWRINLNKRSTWNIMSTGDCAQSSMSSFISIHHLTTSRSPQNIACRLRSTNCRAISCSSIFPVPPIADMFATMRFVHTSTIPW